MEFLELRRDYAGKFVAIENEEKVIASGDTFNEVAKKLQDLNIHVKRNEISIRYIRPNVKDTQRRF